MRVDMEDSPYTATTLELVLEMHERHENTGAVIQSYMRRSLKDVVRLAGAGVSVRLCKGIYDEPREIAYKDFDVVRQNYVLLLEELLRGGSYVGIATHDEYLVWHGLRTIHQMVFQETVRVQRCSGLTRSWQRYTSRCGERWRVMCRSGGWYRVLHAQVKREHEDKLLRGERRDREHRNTVRR